ncbi:flavin monoamine oxidase family protein, partial [Candidatus Auribacterota bacterium]
PSISPLIDSYVKRLKVQQAIKVGYVWKGKFGMVSKEMLEVYIAPDELKDMFTKVDEQMIADFKAAHKGKEFFFDVDPENDKWSELEKMSSYDYLSGYPNEVFDFYNAELGSETGGNIKDLSAIVLVGWEGDEDQGKFLVKGGNQVLAEMMMDDIVKAGGRVLLNSAVTKVEQAGDSVSVETEGGWKYTGKYVVVATPPNVTRYIVKGLPTDKIKALEMAKYAPIHEICLHLKNFPKGKELQAVLFVGEDLDGMINQTGPVLGNPEEGTLVSLTITKSEILELDDEAEVKRAGAVLKKVHPAFDPEKDILGYTIQKWKRGVCKWPPEFAAKYQTVLKEPTGNIYYAGDYTGDPSLMAASWSGIRAAKGVKEKLSKRGK